MITIIEAKELDIHELSEVCETTNSAVIIEDGKVARVIEEVHE